MRKLPFSAVAGAISVVLIVSATSVSSLASDPIVGPSAAWKDYELLAKEVPKKSAPLGIPKSQDCLIEMMRGVHAFEAADFSRRINGEGYIRELREIRPIGVAYVDYPFRANENHGILLVNGDPSIIDVDDFKILPKRDLENDPAYVNLIKKFPEAMLFAGDRYSTESPTVESLAGGGQTFIVSYRLNNICRACERLATVRFGFDFDAEGKLLRVRYGGLELSENAK